MDLAAVGTLSPTMGPTKKWRRLLNPPTIADTKRAAARADNEFSNRETRPSRETALRTGQLARVTAHLVAELGIAAVQAADEVLPTGEAAAGAALGRATGTLMHENTRVMMPAPRASTATVTRADEESSARPATAAGGGASMLSLTRSLASLPGEGGSSLGKAGAATLMRALPAKKRVPGYGADLLRDNKLCHALVALEEAHKAAAHQKKLGRGAGVPFSNDIAVTTSLVDGSLLKSEVASMTTSVRAKFPGAPPWRQSTGLRFNEYGNLTRAQAGLPPAWVKYTSEAEVQRARREADEADRLSGFGEGSRRVSADRERTQPAATCVLRVRSRSEVAVATADIGSPKGREEAFIMSSEGGMRVLEASLKVRRGDSELVATAATSAAVPGTGTLRETASLASTLSGPSSSGSRSNSPLLHRAVNAAIPAETSRLRAGDAWLGGSESGGEGSTSAPGLGWPGASLADAASWGTSSTVSGALLGAASLASSGSQAGAPPPLRTLLSRPTGDGGTITLEGSTLPAGSHRSLSKLGAATSLLSVASTLASSVEAVEAAWDTAGGLGPASASAPPILSRQVARVRPAACALLERDNDALLEGTAQPSLTLGGAATSEAPLMIPSRAMKRSITTAAASHRPLTTKDRVAASTVAWTSPLLTLAAFTSKSITTGTPDVRLGLLRVGVAYAFPVRLHNVSPFKRAWKVREAGWHTRYTPPPPKPVPAESGGESLSTSSVFNPPAGDWSGQPVAPATFQCRYKALPLAPGIGSTIAVVFTALRPGPLSGHLLLQVDDDTLLTVHMSGFALDAGAFEAARNTAVLRGEGVSLDPAAFLPEPFDDPYAPGDDEAAASEAAAIAAAQAEAVLLEQQAQAQESASRQLLASSSGRRPASVPFTVPEATEEEERDDDATTARGSGGTAPPSPTQDEVGAPNYYGSVGGDTSSFGDAGDSDSAPAPGSFESAPLHEAGGSTGTLAGAASSSYNRSVYAPLTRTVGIDAQLAARACDLQGVGSQTILGITPSVRLPDVRPAVIPAGDVMRALDSFAALQKNWHVAWERKQLVDDPHRIPWGGTGRTVVALPTAVAAATVTQKRLGTAAAGRRAPSRG